MLLLFLVAGFRVQGSTITISSSIVASSHHFGHYYTFIVAIATICHFVFVAVLTYCSS